MENFELLDARTLRTVNGGDCECSSAVKAIGGAVAAVANYFDRLGWAISHTNWLGTI